jgi:hypothetical protein
MSFPHRLTPRAALAAVAIASLAAAPASASPVFNLSFIPGTSVAAQNAFTQAAAAWSAVLADSVTIDLTVGTDTLGPGILAQAGSQDTTYSYNAVRTALGLDATSADDATAVANLQAAANLRVLMNYTLNNPNGANSPAAFLDDTGANTATIRVNNANAKALGLTPVLGNLGGDCIGNCDAYIAFSNSFAFDMDPSDGISGGFYDFVGIAVHEIGHALGFVSGVDVLDFNAFGPFDDDLFTFITPLDLFRCTAASAALGAIDWRAGTDTKFFSLDSCGTTLTTFSTGVDLGDGRQASHWKDNLGIGIMDPTTAPGELLAISELDLRAMDVTGWDRVVNNTATPEPATALTLVFGLAGLAMARRRKLG